MVSVVEGPWSYLEDEDTVATSFSHKDHIGLKSLYLQGTRMASAPLSTAFSGGADAQQLIHCGSQVTAFFLMAPSDLKRSSACQPALSTT